MKDKQLSSRERVRLALAHRQTDRIPIAMVCSGINEPARSAFEEYLRAQGRGALQEYLDALVDIKGVGPAYQGPAMNRERRADSAPAAATTRTNA